ncbi:MAG TPA: hypothetical protein VHQ65_04505 [Thermoanaerobaculia bacterium]|nr:hypothetical protein [Thermoanaerobaculia bacterium]
MSEELRRRLREGGPEELAVLLAAHEAELGPEEALAALANPHLDIAGIERVAAQPRLRAAYEVRRALALHPRSPEVLARRFLTALYWRDLTAAGADLRLRPGLRRAADQLLGERLPGLSPGERIAIARRAGGGLIGRFAQERDPRVFAALLENPRLTEGSLLPMIHRERLSAEVLAVVAADPRWGARYPVRLALVRNPATPPQVALRLLPQLKKSDLRAVARDLRLPELVRRRADLLGGPSI